MCRHGVPSTDERRCIDSQDGYVSNAVSGAFRRRHRALADGRSINGSVRRVKRGEGSKGLTSGRHPSRGGWEARAEVRPFVCRAAPKNWRTARLGGGAGTPRRSPYGRAMRNA